MPLCPKCGGRIDVRGALDEHGVVSAARWCCLRCGASPAPMAATPIKLLLCRNCRKEIPEPEYMLHIKEEQGRFATLC